MQLEWTGDTWQHQQRQLNRSNFFLSTDGSNSHSFLLHSTLCSANAFLSSSLIRTRHSLSRASHVHTNTFAGYHTATLTFLLSRHSLFSDLESKGSGQRLRKNQVRPPQLLSKKKKMHGWRNRHRWRSINFQTRFSSLCLFSKLEAVSKANGQPVLHLLQAGECLKLLTAL